MIRHTVIPTQNILTINLPEEMIGKKIEITLSEIENSAAQKEYSLNETTINLVEEERIKIKYNPDYLIDWDIAKETLKD